MGAQTPEVVFGPVPSRRLGQSLGINNIPPKTCSYACAYCQVGRTTEQRDQRCSFYDPAVLLREVDQRLADAPGGGAAVDYVTVVPDGEPTLDLHLDRLIEGLQARPPRIAVITNGSLFADPAVRAALMPADWVSVKVDSVSEVGWRKVNRPHRGLQLDRILEGIRRFAREYEGKLVTETMLVGGCNDGDEDIAAVAGFLAEITPRHAYLAIPTRPPVESWVAPPGAAELNRAYQILDEQVASVEFLTGDEGDAFGGGGAPAEELLRITAVHPMRAAAVRALLARVGASWSLVEDLVRTGRLAKVAYRDQVFYIRVHAARHGE